MPLGAPLRPPSLKPSQVVSSWVTIEAAIEVGVRRRAERQPDGAPHHPAQQQPAGDVQREVGADEDARRRTRRPRPSRPHARARTGGARGRHHRGSHGRVPRRESEPGWGRPTRRRVQQRLRPAAATACFTTFAAARSPCRSRRGRPRAGGGGGQRQARRDEHRGRLPACITAHRAGRRCAAGGPPLEGASLHGRHLPGRRRRGKTGRRRAARPAQRARRRTRRSRRGLSRAHRSPRRCSSANAIQPGRIGSQNVAMRYRKTAGTATSRSRPTAVSPAMSAASTAPMPPGVGAAELIAEPTQEHDADAGDAHAAAPKACTRETRAAM